MRNIHGVSGYWNQRVWYYSILSVEILERLQNLLQILFDGNEAQLGEELAAEEIYN